MKPMLSFVLPWLSLLAAAPAAPPSPATLVEHENVFARDVAESGVRDAFLKWLSPKAVVFRPGPVNGHKAYSESKPSHAVLAWTPAYAALSRGGDLGWTTGPWSWSRDKGSDPVAWGEYLSVWKRQEDGGFKAVLDAGISHDKPQGAPAAVVQFEPAEMPRTGRGPLDRRRTLWKADSDFGALAKLGGVSMALEKYGGDGLVLLREGMQRVTGRGAACDTVRAREGSATLMSLAQFLSESGDLGYTYGSFVTGPVAEPDSAYYVHVWHRGTAKPWELVVELVQPVPKATKK
jgi:ketosteroid isomerase-like protein